MKNHPNTSRINSLLVALLALWPLLLLLKVFVLQLLGLVPYRVVLFSAFAVWVVAWIYAYKNECRIPVFAWVVSLVISLCLLFTDWNEQLFLGKVIACDYLADAPGYSEIKVFSRGTCRISYGGIMGNSEVWYCDYKIRDNEIQILTTGRIVDLGHTGIRVNGTDLIIRRYEASN